MDKRWILQSVETVDNVDKCVNNLSLLSSLIRGPVDNYVRLENGK